MRYVDGYDEKEFRRAVQQNIRFSDRKEPVDESLFVPLKKAVEEVDAASKKVSAHFPSHEGPQGE